MVNSFKSKFIVCEFIETYPDVIGMLFAHRGRGLAYKLLGKYGDAQKDFADVIKMIDEKGEIMEVQPLKAQCTINWAEVSLELEQYDEAIASLDKMLKENRALESDPKLADQGLLTKAKVLGAKAAKSKTTSPTGATALYQQAIAVLRGIIQKESPSAYEARTLMAKFVAEAGQEKPDPDSLLPK